MHIGTGDGLEASEISLEKDVRMYKQLTYAESTKAAYACQLNKYYKFCKIFGYEPVPINDDVLCKYVAYLARTFCPSSIRQYLNVVRILHLENGFPNPLHDNFCLNAVLRGVQRSKGGFVAKKLPITVDILNSFLGVLNLANSQNLVFWAACLIGFYGMLRKSSLFPRQVHEGHMCVSSCVIYEWGLKLSLDYSKTIQCRERRVFVALPWNRENVSMCPVSSLLRALQSSGCCQASDYLFTFLSKGKKVPMTYALFSSMLKHVLHDIGLSDREYSGHSLRRGGATHALNKGVPVEMIKAQGDWKSLAYLEYIDQSSSKTRAEHVGKMY